MGPTFPLTLSPAQLNATANSARPGPLAAAIPAASRTVPARMRDTGRGVPLPVSRMPAAAGGGRPSQQRRREPAEQRRGGVQHLRPVSFFHGASRPSQPVQRVLADHHLRSLMRTLLPHQGTLPIFSNDPPIALWTLTPEYEPDSVMPARPSAPCATRWELPPPRTARDGPPPGLPPAPSANARGRQARAAPPAAGHCFHVQQLH